MFLQMEMDKNNHTPWPSSDHTKHCQLTLILTLQLFRPISFPIYRGRKQSWKRGEGTQSSLSNGKTHVQKTIWLWRQSSISQIPEGSQYSGKNGSKPLEVVTKSHITCASLLSAGSYRHTVSHPLNSTETLSTLFIPPSLLPGANKSLEKLWAIKGHIR